MQDPLRIGLFSPALPDSGLSNGIVTYTRVMRDALTALGHSVIVVTPTEIVIDGSRQPVHRANKLLRRLRKFRETRNLANGADAWVNLQVIEAFEAAKFAGAQVFEIEESFGWAGELVGRGIPIVERLHGPHCLVRDDYESRELEQAGRLREDAELSSFQRVEAITAPTGRMLAELEGRYGLRSLLGHVIPNPIPDAVEAAAWSQGAADPDQVLFIGRIDRCKGADVLIEAFSRALRDRPSLRLVMVGPDRGVAQPDGTLHHFDQLASAQLTADQKDRIEFIGVQSPERIQVLRAKSALAIVASRFENFPYSIAEAMSAGMPIVTTDTFGGGEMIRDGIDGLVVPIGDAEAMSRAILEMIGNPARAASFAQSARLRAADWLSPKRVAMQTIKVYRDVIAKAQIPAYHS